MARKNYLIEGVSGTGKSAVCHELRRRGYEAIDGDNELAYQGDPESGRKSEEARHEHHIWDVGKVREIAASRESAVAFFCGGSRNFRKFIHLFDGVFVLDVDVDTLNRRLDARPGDDWGKRQAERELILRLHASKEDLPRDATVVDATRSLEEVVDEMIRRAEA